MYTAPTYSPPLCIHFPYPEKVCRSACIAWFTSVNLMCLHTIGHMFVSFLWLCCNDLHVCMCASPSVPTQPRSCGNPRLYHHLLSTTLKPNEAVTLITCSGKHTTISCKHTTATISCSWPISGKFISGTSYRHNVHQHQTNQIQLCKGNFSNISLNISSLCQEL